MADLKNTVINDTGFINLPRGTTAQRPANVPGATRFNTDLGYVETYYNGAWGDLIHGKGFYLPRNDLVVELSYDDPNSWPGSGTQWFDTSPNNYTFNITSACPDTGQQAMNFSTNDRNAIYANTASSDVPGLSGDVTYVCVCRILNSTSQWRTLTRSWVSDHHVIIQSGAWNMGVYDNDSAGFIDNGFDQTNLPSYPDGYMVFIWRWVNETTSSMPTHTMNVNAVAAHQYTGSFNNSNGRYNRGFHILGGHHASNNNPASGSQPWGWIKYFAAYNRRLEDWECQMVNSTLRERYGI